MTLVLWSGGCDSTLILAKLAQQASSANPVRALSIEHDQVFPRKQHREARKKALCYFREKGWHVVHSTCLVSSKGKFQATGGDHLSHPIFWIMTAITYLEREEDLYLGYVREDCIWHYKDTLHKVFQSAIDMMGKYGKIQTPLEWTPKRTVVSELKKMELIKRVWWCEDPKKGVACEKCAPCLLHQTALIELRQGYGAGLVPII